MTELPIRPSADIAQADWIAPRLDPFDSGLMTSVVPGGFPAYARLLHPLADAGDGQTWRWADVARWSGLPLREDVDFPEIAFPEDEPDGAEPWSRLVPETGELPIADAAALARRLAARTRTPDRCWFCTWEGWGAIGFEDGPRVSLPNRTYELRQGPLDALPDLIQAQAGYSPNLWWPDDHAWCVATEIDLTWTYVGGPEALIAEVLADPQLEAQSAALELSHHRRMPAWLGRTIDDTADRLLEAGTATLHTWRGDLHAELRAPDETGDGDLRIERRTSHGVPGRGWTRMSERDPRRLRRNVVSQLTWAVLELL